MLAGLKYGIKHLGPIAFVGGLNPVPTGKICLFFPCGIYLQNETLAYPGS